MHEQPSRKAANVRYQRAWVPSPVAFLGVSHSGVHVMIAMALNSAGGFLPIPDESLLPSFIVEV